jgi:multidrug efflux system membrane fusion protein
MSEGSYKPLMMDTRETIAPVVRRPAVKAGIALALLLAAAGAWSLLKPGAGGRGREDRAVPVSVATAGTKAMPVEISTFGRVQAIASVALRSRIDGVIAAVPVREGQDVAEGQVLFTLDDRQARAVLKQAEGTLARDRAQLENARRELARLAPLEEKSFVSKQQIDLARSTVAALEGAVDADIAAADNARVQLSYTAIRAPIAGRVGSVSSKVGNTVHSNDATPLLTINQLRPIYVSLSVPQASFPPLQAALAAGPVPVKVSVQGEPSAADTGVITFVENAVDTMTNTVGVKATVPNDGLKLWPGQFVDVLITLKVDQNATVVPVEAVQNGPNGTFVFVVGPENVVAMKPVEVSRTVGGDSVIARGLAPGDMVVTVGQMALEPGSRVRIKTADGAAPDAPRRAGGRS